MDQPKGKALQLDADHAAFIQGAVSVVVSSRNSQHVPDVVRGCGCRVTRDRRRVTVLVEAARAGSVLDDIAANGLIAVVFSQPSTHRTIQLKGSDARITRVTGADRAIAQRHLRPGYRPAADWLRGRLRPHGSRRSAGPRGGHVHARVGIPADAGPGRGTRLGNDPADHTAFHPRLPRGRCARRRRDLRR
jgi:hypothetical protein